MRNIVEQYNKQYTININYSAFTYIHFDVK